jgi:hypothetical protein
MERNNIRLKRIPPERFDGNRSHSIIFLTKFKRYILMNKDAAIAQDLYKRAAFFLSLIGGIRMDGWVKWLYD